MLIIIIIIIIGAFGTVSKRLLKGLEAWKLADEWRHPNDGIIENGQNTKKSPGDFKRLALTQTPVKNHRLTLM